MIAVSTSHDSGTYSFLEVIINEVTVPIGSDASASGATRLAGTVIIPPGATYSIESPYTLNEWAELR